MKRLLLAGALCGTLLQGLAADDLERGFANPPISTKPWCYWYWISDNISREGITRDLEAMKRVGIGEAFIGNIYLEEVQAGAEKALSESWWGMVTHAVQEGGRIGVNVGLFNCPGWSQSGGPWIKPEQAMRYVASSEHRVRGPKHLEAVLSKPNEQFQDLCVLAFPAPVSDTDQLAQRNPVVSALPQTAEAGLAFDGRTETAFTFPADAGQGGNPYVIEVEVAEPFTARSLVLRPAPANFAAQCELAVAEKNGEFRVVRSFPVDRSNNGVNVGFVPHAPVSVTFPAVTSRKFRLSFTQVRGAARLAEVEISAGARVERYIEKQLAKMHPTPLPMWDAYLWPATEAVGGEGLAVKPGQVHDLTRNLQPDGRLVWDAPSGDWIVLRLGLVPTGTKNAPASPEGQGLEVDKMNWDAAQAHFDAFIGNLLARVPKKDRKAFRRVIADSYEMGSQNWTDGFRKTFKDRYGYDPQAWLPVLTGRVVGNAEQSDRFLWDLRRLVADQVAYGYVGGLREACHREGLKLWLENYGHWGFPAEFLQYGGQSDEVSGEFWATGDLGSIELRAAASAAHTYGKPIVSAEAFTSVLKFESTPWSLKKRGDWALTEGINHWVLHVYIHQPWEDRLPGVNAWFSTEFNRHNTWFEQSREWIDYYRRCDFLLQQGKHVADVAYFIGEDAPKMTGIRDPELPAGYNYDYINAEVIEKRLKVKNRRFVLPDGMSYSLLVLPRVETMRPELLRKIRDLVAGGGSILGEPPLRSPSLEGYPSCDQRVRLLAEELWGDAVARGGTGVRPFKNGLVFRGTDLQPVFQALRIGPDVSGIDSKTILWTHRSAPDAEIYFLSNQSEQPANITPVFRGQGRVPELWDAVSAGNRQAAVFQTTLTGTRVALRLEPRGSMFVVFRGKVANQPVITEILEKDKVFLSALQAAELSVSKGSKSAGSFTMAMWVKPAGKIGLPAEADSGVQLQQVRNEAVVPPHGESLFPGGGQAGAGISVGQNGVVVYEHSGNYFAPLLTAALELKDWAHLAVVYSNNRPVLFINGKLVRQGLQSRYQVHSGLAVSPSGNSGFKGALAAVQDFSQALPRAQVAELARSRPVLDAGSALAGVSLFPVSGNGLEADVASTQPLTFLWSNGEQNRVQLFDLPTPKELSGPWQVRFPTCRDVPEQITLDTLAPLNEHENPAVKHFSGTVTYAREFKIDADRLVPGRRLWLDLGTVESIAEVIVNGRNLGIFWKPPFVVDISSAARPGKNSVEVRVTGTWRNRLIGQAKYPDGFASSNSGAQFQPYLAVDIKVSPNETLAPFGLIGPVRLQSSQRVPLRP